MIKKIGTIRDFGIYRNNDASREIEDFARYNLIYGWNGTGKSTLSKLFKILEDNKIPEEFINSQFEIIDDSGSIYSQDSYKNFMQPIKVFNTSFVEQNINWDDTVKGILLVSKEKIEE